MDNIKIRDYGDYVIQYNLNNNSFEAVKNNEVRLKAVTENELHAKIDSAVKRQEKLKTKVKFPIDAIYCPYGIPKVGKITSVGDDGGFWFSYTVNNEQKREKISRRYNDFKFYPTSEHNLSLVNQYQLLDKQINALEKQRNTSTQGMTDADTITKLLETD